jgi:hypothetical protein
MGRPMMTPPTHLTDSEPGWREATARFLTAVDGGQRATVAALLRQPRWGGRGLRAWLRLVADQGQPLPAVLPTQLVEVYLQDTEAEPLHDCARCGLAVPVRPGWRRAPDGVPEAVYFPACPCCGGPTGPYAYWSRGADGTAN